MRTIILILSLSIASHAAAKFEAELNAVIDARIAGALASRVA